MKKWVIKSGIQRKYLRYIMGLLLLAILLSSIGVWIYVRQSLTTEVTDKYEFLNEKMGLALDTLSKEADEGTAECITYDQVQESLKKASFADVEKNSLQKYFAYMNLDHVAEYCYVDNKIMFMPDPTRILIMKIFQTAIWKITWEILMRKHNGSGRRILCLGRRRKHCLSEDMYTAWNTPANQDCCSSR